MIQRSIRTMFLLFAVVLIVATVASAQNPTTTEVVALPTINNWQAAQSSAAGHERKLFVVTVDQPQRKQTCRVRSFTEDKLVCKSRTYLPQQVLAIILPSDHALRWFLGLNAGLGASIYGTVVLAAICPACAAATAFTTLVCFSFAGAIAMSDNRPEHLLYLAEGQHLTGKLSSLEP